MFEVGGNYANRMGKYTVLAVNPPRMTVRYESGEVTELNIGIQQRIWENIVAEEEARTLSRSARAARRGMGADTRFFIKPMSLLAAEELTFPGWQERIAASNTSSQEIRPGDRLIYYAVEAQVFFAVATITGGSYESVTRDGKQTEEEVRFFPVDLDAYAQNLEKAVSLDSVELESQPNVRDLLNQSDTYIPISEDDFELLAELLTEVAEEDEEEEEEEEEEYED
ncbi:MAG: EVE domain-containing protein [Chloroflexi bacterium]|nr:EVE domain-containing protein [Chloroflexota bacterium]MCI0577552.1 EVE domain-containing protein [Chloroflexota bacterium]MCI0645609.1 EVE domain-containing protein [Chloroflexota bacterium]MCI0725521.1 EVE domain-containing protein [Chloroflexota bacterium]